MNTTKTIYLSKKGIKELKKSISRLEREQHEHVAHLREMDKSDSREERLARVERLSLLEMVETELADKQETLSHSRLLPRKRDALKVAIGSVVDLVDTSGRLIRYTIVESFEANPSDGRISAESPLGRSLLGKQLQDMIEWTAGLGTNRAQLISIT